MDSADQSDLTQRRRCFTGDRKMAHLEDMEMEEKAEPLRRVAGIPARIHASPKVAYPNRDTPETPGTTVFSGVDIMSKIIGSRQVKFLGKLRAT